MNVQINICPLNRSMLNRSMRKLLQEMLCNLAQYNQVHQGSDWEVLSIGFNCNWQKLEIGGCHTTRIRCQNVYHGSGQLQMKFHCIHYFQVGNSNIFIFEDIVESHTNSCSNYIFPSIRFRLDVNVSNIQLQILLRT